MDVISSYPDVTLLVAAENGGPYRLIQTAIESTCFDAYLFQDADDWSAPDRLETLLAAASDSGAELIGSHEVRVLVDQGDAVGVRYPLDVNEALVRKPTSFPLLHPTSLVGRDLVVRIGGFATGMRFSGDAEFLRRAGYAARVVNVDHFGYFRRKREGSLTTAPDTGLSSPERLRVQETLAARARANAEAVAAGQPPDLEPWVRTRPAALRHEMGPSLEGAPARRHARRPPSQKATPSGGLVFVVGPPRSGETLVAWALAQHPSFRLLHDARWLARVAGDIVTRATDEAALAPGMLLPEVGSALAATAQAFAPDGSTLVAAAGDVTEHAWALANLFPASRFVFVSRDFESSVASVLRSPTEGGEYFTPDLAQRRWIATTRSSLDLQTVLGPDRVLRVRYEALVDDPAVVMSGVLKFLGAEIADACMLPFAGVSAAVAGVATPTEMSSAIAEQVTDLSFQLAAAPSPAEAVDVASALARLQKRASRSGAVEGSSLVEKVRQLVGRAVPEGSIVVTVTKGDPRLIDVAGTVGWHFPQVEDGTYAGHHPASGAEAIAHLEELRARGAEYFLIPSASLWWMEFYDDLRRHLEATSELVAYVADAGAVYSLQAAGRDGIRLVWQEGDRG